jgi:Ca2+-binding EF-hand superfamily protein
MALSEEKIAEIKEAFYLYDITPEASGATVPTKSLIALFRSIGESPAPPDMKSYTKQLDKDGIIRQDDFIALMRKKVQSAPNEHSLLAAFEVLDRKRRGYLEQGELEAALTRVGYELSADEFREFIKESNAHNGRVDYREFVRVLTAK